jgi:CRISPR-associated protein Csx1
LLQLALPAKTLSLGEFKSTVERAVECWKLKRGVQSGGTGALKVASSTRFASGFWALVHARAVLEGARRLLELDEKRALPEEAGVVLDELKRLRELERGSRVVGELVNREISKLDYLEEQWRELQSSGWKRCSELRMGFGFEGGGGGEFKRDFIAHAGFHSEVIEIRLTEKRLEMKMRNDQWESVKQVLREVTYEGA